ncbi:hypothetical protein MHM99_19595 [Alteromonas sp. MmMcT2-2]|uniref:hypothetical protein n=1 Tax=Alteromonas sp. MmMcT2-2 TaxID=2917732 RepID=UPI001EF2CD4C|nr:hypothetical protein [Alteromonas sp. MmMcT2-2]MCG7643692.1 hypothetical protein [Alteromonas sp. MmMcT2-2]
MQVEPSLEHVLTQIDSLKSEFADIEANLYEQLAIDGQLKTLDALSLQKAVDCVELASKRLESYVITPDVKSVVIAMLMLDIKLEYRKFSSICPRLVGKKVSELGYRAMFLKFFDLVEREIERYDNKKAPSTDIANPITALENHIQQEVAKEVKKVVGPVNSIIQLLMNDYAFLTSVSGVTRQSQTKDRQRYFRMAKETREGYIKRFKKSVVAAWDKVTSLNEELVELKAAKKSQIMSLNKELKKTREKALRFQTIPDPMSELLGIDIGVSKDEEIAALSRKVDSLESANTELQRENIRLEKKLSIKVM